MPGLISTFDSISEALDSTAQRLQALAAHRLHLDTAFRNIEGGVAMWDGEERLMLANHRIAAMFGLPPELVAPGLTFRDFVTLCVEEGHLDGHEIDEVYHVAIALIRRRNPVTYDEMLSNGHVLQVSYHPQEAGGWLATYEDVTERQQAQAQVAFMAHHDALTRLANRTLFQERLRDALARVGDVAVLYLDLDRFKEVNDTLGHSTGDTMLRYVAGRLANCFHQGDTVARLGGDEFAVILTPGSADTAEAAARKVIDILGRPFDIDANEIAVGTSVGIALAPRHGSDPDTLLRNADLALYAAKADGRGTFRFFEQAMQDRLVARRDLENDMRGAMSNDGFQLLYQPLVSTRLGIVSGFEALMRWNHPQRGLVSPSEFIPIAEASGLIIPLGQWAIRRACADLARLPQHLRMAVNLSPVQFRSPDLVRTVREALQEAGVAAHRLELEVTETTLMKDTDAAASVLSELRAAGVRIAMDDFGTGYSSLAYLRNFPFDKIKIDKSFIDDIGQRRGSDAIIRAVTGIAASLGIETVAEGVESVEQYQSVVREGCDLIQGYLFARPSPASALPATIARIDSGQALLPSRRAAAERRPELAWQPTDPAGHD